MIYETIYRRNYYSFNNYLYYFQPPILPNQIEENEVDVFEVELLKDTQGLGITIAGYVGDKSAGWY